MRLVFFLLSQLCLLKTSCRTVNLSSPTQAARLVSSLAKDLHLSPSQLDFLAKAEHQLFFSSGCHSTGILKPMLQIGAWKCNFLHPEEIMKDKWANNQSDQQTN